MKTVIDYSNSPAPNFDAVRDIQDYLGAKYDKVAGEMAKVTDGQTFQFFCSIAGIEGKPVQAWYDHFHGQGKWDSLPDW